MGVCAGGRKASNGEREGEGGSGGMSSGVGTNNGHVCPQQGNGEWGDRGWGNRE